MLERHKISVPHDLKHVQVIDPETKNFIEGPFHDDNNNNNNNNNNDNNNNNIYYLILRKLTYIKRG